MNLFGHKFGYAKPILQWTTAFTIPAAVLDLLNALPKFAQKALHLNGFLGFFEKYLPLFDKGLGWILPAAIGCIIGVIIYFARKKNDKGNTADKKIEVQA